jgi:hypothetical protein
LKKAQMRQMDKIVLADRFHLDNLLNFCLNQIRTQGGQLDFYSNQYERLSDKTKVQILEKLHHIQKPGEARNPGMDLNRRVEVREFYILYAVFTQKCNKKIPFLGINKPAGIGRHRDGSIDFQSLIEI